MSVVKYPGPDMMFREPARPGKVKVRLLLNVLSGFLKMFGPEKEPSLRMASRVRPVEVGPVQVPEDVRKKLVAKLNPSAGPNGKPDRHRAAPVSSQPPTTASVRRLALPKYLRPLPKGRSTTQYPLKLCRRLKSDNARPSRRSNGF